MKNVVVVLVLAIPTTVTAEPTRDYAVKDRETCLEIATHELGSARRLADLHRLNPQLGASPHHLKPGQILKLPVVANDPDAHLETPRGRVEVRRAGDASWGAGTSGQALFRQWRVGTREQSSARVAFADTSTIEMRDNTVVVLFGPSSRQQPMTRTTLERGVLRARLALLDGKPRLDVATPAGNAELVDGVSIVDVDASGETRLANHAGKPVKLSNSRGKVSVPAGYGSKAVRAKPPTPPEPLPPAPTWAATDELVLAWASDPHPVRGAWTAVPVATRYRIEIARADAPDAIEARIEVPGTVSSFEAQNLPAAEYIATVASVDAKGFEGPASTPRHVQVVELPRPEPVAGTTLVVPAGLSCTTSATTTSLVVVPDDRGRVAIRCNTARGTAQLELAIPAPEIAIEGGGGAPQIAIGEEAVVEIATRRVAQGSAHVTARGGVEIVHVKPIPSGLRVVIRGAAARDAAIVVSLIETGTVIGTVDVHVTHPPESPRIAVTAAGLSVGLATFAGMSAARTRDGGIVGAELSIEAARGVASIIAVERIDQIARYRVGLSWSPRGGARPLAQLAGSLEDDRLGVDLGAGIEIGPRWLSVRAMADFIADDRDRRVHVTGGVSMRLW